MSTLTTPAHPNGRARKKVDEYLMTASAIYSRKREREMSPTSKEKRNRTLGERRAAKREQERTENQGDVENLSGARKYSMTANAIKLREFEAKKTLEQKEEDRKKRKARNDAKSKQKRTENSNDVQGAKYEKLLADKDALVTRDG